MAAVAGLQQPHARHRGHGLAALLVAVRSNLPTVAAAIGCDLQGAGLQQLPGALEKGSYGKSPGLTTILLLIWLVLLKSTNFLLLSLDRTNTISTGY